MIETVQLFPGIVLRCFRDDRFKQGVMSVQFLRPMDRGEAAANALLPSVLLRGTQAHPDLRSITKKLDDLYGAAVGATVRRVGDYQTVGFSCSFIEDRFTLSGDAVLEPMILFLKELLLQPKLEEGVFCEEFVEGEKKNLISTIEAERNDKRQYAASRLLRKMCSGDTFGVPRLGEKEQVAALCAESLYRHYEKVLKESAVAIFYVGSASAEQVAQQVKNIFADLPREVCPLPPHAGFRDLGGVEEVETLEVNQGKLCMGFVTPITYQAEEYAAMQVLNTLYGGGMTSKLFMNVREKLSLCYSVGSSYYGSKGIVLGSAGIDFEKEKDARQEILAQLEACRNNDFTDAEMDAAKQALLSALRAVLDGPHAIENYCCTDAILGFPLSLEEYKAAISGVTREQVVAAAQKLRYHSSYFLKGVTA